MEKDVIINNQVNIIKKPELLAPAGDLERLKFACLYGSGCSICWWFFI